MRITTRLLQGLAVGLALLVSTAASASNWNLVLNGRAVHVNASRDWNESNWGLGFEREFDSGARWVKLAMANGFEDSDGYMSYMAGGGIKRRFRLDAFAPEWRVDVGVVGFLMTRHDVDNNRRFPGVLPVMSIGTDRMAINMTYLPKPVVTRVIPLKINDPTVSGVLYFQFTFNAGLLRFGRSDRFRLASAD